MKKIYNSIKSIPAIVWNNWIGRAFTAIILSGAVISFNTVINPPPSGSIFDYTSYWIVILALALMQLVHTDIHAAYDVTVKIRGTHFKRTALRILYIAFFSWLTFRDQWNITIAVGLFLASLFWLTFDFNYNIRYNKHYKTDRSLFYLGGNSWLDKLGRKLHPITYLAVKIIFFIYTIILLTKVL